MSDNTKSDRPGLHRGRVLRVEWLSPHMARVVLGGEGLKEFSAGRYTDHYVKLVFPLEGVRYPEPFDIAAIRRDFPRDQWPRTRTYTVRRWDPDAGELSVDFVHHGDRGLAGPWAATVKPGEEIHLIGPGGGYAPRAEADWHLLAGDESALPAIGAALEALPAGAVAKAFIEVSGPEEEQEIQTRADAEITWLHRGERQIGDALREAVSGFDFPAGTVHGFVHGEAHTVKGLRHHLRLERGLTRDQLSISGYWRRGADEDGWQSTKSEWNRDVEDAPAA
ncbi:siderophore-interacting protein [Streptomyces sp. BPPL-273]|uniref:siderophore-interacting protein n=1 Tax=Streptomyces TaxID=1883 RepID=UPI0024AF0F38|nr:siderophore-interacting protein [Streptomyces sp. BPPL-273]WHM28611.1 siderophore-interacting protein [Streptomyces sp. BPPL-273]